MQASLKLPKPDSCSERMAISWTSGSWISCLSDTLWEVTFLWFYTRLLLSLVVFITLNMLVWVFLNSCLKASTNWFKKRSVCLESTCTRWASVNTNGAWHLSEMAVLSSQSRMTKPQSTTQIPGSVGSAYTALLYYFYLRPPSTDLRWSQGTSEVLPHVIWVIQSYSADLLDTEFFQNLWVALVSTWSPESSNSYSLRGSAQS